MKKKFKLLSTDNEEAYIYYVENPCKLTYQQRRGIVLKGSIKEDELKALIHHIKNADINETPVGFVCELMIQNKTIELLNNLDFSQVKFQLVLEQTSSDSNTKAHKILGYQAGPGGEVLVEKDFINAKDTPKEGEVSTLEFNNTDNTVDTDVENKNKTENELQAMNLFEQNRLNMLNLQKNNKENNLLQERMNKEKEEQAKIQQKKINNEQIKK